MSAVVVIHQPNGYIFEIFDRLILLSGGSCVFSDHVTRLGDFYEHFFGEVPPNSIHELPVDIMRKLKDVDKNKVQDLDTSMYEPTQRNDNGDVTSRSQPSPEEPQKTVSVLWKFAVVFDRNLTNHYVRNVTNLVARLVLYACIALLNGCLYWQVGKDQDESVIGAFTFLLLGSYLLPFAAITMFINEKKFFLCEREFRLYSPWIYCISQGVLEMWILSLCACISCLVVIPMGVFWNPSIDSKAESFMLSLSALIASNLVGSNLILFLSILMPSQDLTFLAGAGIVCLSLGTSGGFVPFPSIHGFVGWLQWISPCKYSLQALALAFYQGSPKGELILESTGLNSPGTVSTNLAVLLAFYVCLAVATVITLSKKRIKR